MHSACPFHLVCLTMPTCAAQDIRTGPILRLNYPKIWFPSPVVCNDLFIVHRPSGIYAHQSILRYVRDVHTNLPYSISVRDQKSTTTHASIHSATRHHELYYPSGPTVLLIIVRRRDSSKEMNSRSRIEAKLHNSECAHAAQL
jgi:hypothetical protein